MVSKAVANFWQDFLASQGLSAGELQYEEAWAFGNSPEMADELSALVLAGTKTGTSSAQQIYQQLGEPLPAVDAYSILLDGQNQPVCVVKTNSVTVLPFLAVDETQALKEGEGELSLAYWRQVHQAFWEETLPYYGLTFSPEMSVVYEEFAVVYRA